MISIKTLLKMKRGKIREIVPKPPQKDSFDVRPINIEIYDLET